MGLRTRQEGAVGLMILAGLGLFGGLIAWIQSFGLGQERYRVVVEFEDAKGMQVGAVLRYRGVEIGKAVSIRPTSRAVEVEVEIVTPNLRIPGDAIVEAQSAALLGEKFMDIISQTTLDNEESLPLPVDAACNPDVIVCEGSVLVGVAPADLTDLIRSSNQIAELFTNPLLVTALEEFASGAGAATTGLRDITTNFTELTTSLNAEMENLSTTLTSIGDAAVEIQATATEARSILEENRSALGQTLNGFSRASDGLVALMGDLSPAVQQVTEGEMLSNLETLSKNLRQASAQLVVAGRAINSPENSQMLQDILESARATFQNTQKITTDVDELTGDARLRNDLRLLLEGMGRLFSAADQLDQQVAVLNTLGSDGIKVSEDIWVSEDWHTWQREAAQLQALLDDLDRAAQETAPDAAQRGDRQRGDREDADPARGGEALGRDPQDRNAPSRAPQRQAPQPPES
ncbi:MAG: MlaD family protein [Prochlorothrix sp.]